MANLPVGVFRVDGRGGAGHASLKGAQNTWEASYWPTKWIKNANRKCEMLLPLGCGMSGPGWLAAARELEIEPPQIVLATKLAQMPAVPARPLLDSGWWPLDVVDAPVGGHGGHVHGLFRADPKNPCGTSWSQIRSTADSSGSPRANEWHPVLGECDSLHRTGGLALLWFKPVHSVSITVRICFTSIMKLQAKEAARFRLETYR